MIRHIVMWDFAEGFTPEENRLNAVQIKSALEDMLFAIEGVVFMQVVIDSMETSNADILLDSTFTDVAALQKCYEHPAYERILEFMEECTVNKKRMDFEV